MGAPKYTFELLSCFKCYQKQGEHTQDIVKCHPWDA